MVEYFISYMYQKQSGVTSHSFMIFKHDGGTHDAIDYAIEKISNDSKIGKYNIVVQSFNRV